MTIRLKPIPALVWLAVCAALAMGGLYYWSVARADRAARLAGVAASLDPARRGLLLLDARRDPSLPARLLYEPLAVARDGGFKAHFPKRAYFRLALLGGFVLQSPQALWLEVASDDGLRVRLDGRMVYDAWHLHTLLRDRVRLELGAGPHVIEADYFQARGPAALSLRLVGPGGVAIALHPPAPGWRPAAWQALIFSEKEQRFRAAALFGLALLWLLAGAAWVFAGPLPAWFRALARPERPRPPPPAPLPRDWLIPSAVFAAFALMVLAAMAWQGAELPRTILLGKWDESWYRRIMMRGYYLDLAFPLYMKGSISWFPLFSWLARPLFWLGVHPWWATLITAWLAALAAFHALYRLALRLFGRPAAVWSLVFLAAYPCSFYLLVGYPYGVALLAGAAYFWCLLSGRTWWAVLLGIMAGLAYPLAVAVAVLPLFVYLPRALRAEDPWPALRALVLTAAAPALGMALLFAHHWWAFGDFLAYLDSQTGWGRRADWPWEPIYRHLAGASWRDPLNLALLLWLGGAAAFAHRFLPALWGLLGAAFVLNHATGSLLSNFRQYLAAWPWFLLLGSSPRPVWIKAAWTLGMLWLFWSQYLPAWLARRLM